jgi:hypothetical protein
MLFVIIIIKINIFSLLLVVVVVVVVATRLSVHATNNPWQNNRSGQVGSQSVSSKRETKSPLFGHRLSSTTSVCVAFVWNSSPQTIAPQYEHYFGRVRTVLF